MVANHTSNQEIGVGVIRAGPTHQLESERFAATGTNSIAPEAWPITLDGNRAPCLQVRSSSTDHIATNVPKNAGFPPGRHDGHNGAFDESLSILTIAAIQRRCATGTRLRGLRSGRAACIDCPFGKVLSRYVPSTAIPIAWELVHPHSPRASAQCCRSDVKSRSVSTKNGTKIGNGRTWNDSVGERLLRSDNHWIHTASQTQMGDIGTESLPGLDAYRLDHVGDLGISRRARNQ